MGTPPREPVTGTLLLSSPVEGKLRKPSLPVGTGVPRITSGAGCAGPGGKGLADAVATRSRHVHEQPMLVGANPRVRPDPGTPRGSATTLSLRDPDVTRFPRSQAPAWERGKYAGEFLSPMISAVFLPKGTLRGTLFAR